MDSGDRRNCSEFQNKRVVQQHVWNNPVFGLLMILVMAVQSAGKSIPDRVQIDIKIMDPNARDSSNIIKLKDVSLMMKECLTAIIPKLLSEEKYLVGEGGTFLKQHVQEIITIWLKNLNEVKSFPHPMKIAFYGSCFQNETVLIIVREKMDHYCYFGTNQGELMEVLLHNTGSSKVTRTVQILLPGTPVHSMELSTGNNIIVFGGKYPYERHLFEMKSCSNYKCPECSKLDCFWWNNRCSTREECKTFGSCKSSKCQPSNTEKPEDETFQPTFSSFDDGTKIRETKEVHTTSGKESDNKEIGVGKEFGQVSTFMTTGINETESTQEKHPDKSSLAIVFGVIALVLTLVLALVLALVFRRYFLKHRCRGKRENESVSCTRRGSVQELIEDSMMKSRDLNYSLD